MNILTIPDKPLQGEIIRREPDDFKAGDFVTRDGTDIHFVLDREWESVDVVCIVPNNLDYWVPGELELNIARRYSNINHHFLPFAKSEFEKVKLKFPAEWFTTYEILK